ncbi:MAG: tRNA 2-selenouridine(34) synthase MnmH [Spirochaetaceae bacterium]|jgi:tRNA 2-selenouridine synthase|nr:tRNA 2-selenouridine(34) synthase MnmH [Spirochaetaceae bacterium]
MIEEITLEKFYSLSHQIPVIDVRAPIEYEHGHIPGTVNVPLFNDEERVQIGTVYKNKGDKEAISLGESFAIPRISHYLKEVRKIGVNKTIIVLCSRGGMRSQRFSEMLSDNQFHVYRLVKGYKNYRRIVQGSFTEKFPLIVIGGKTGSGKTEILIELEKQKEQMINLEFLSNHRGSAFGAIGMGDQPTTEQFENELYEIMKKFDLNRRIWVEDESSNIGRVFLPGDLYEQMKISPLIILEMDKNFRVKRLCQDYASEGLEPLVKGIRKIEKRLGMERVKVAIKAVESRDYFQAASIILEYYDKCYSYGVTKKRNSIIDHFTIEDDDPFLVAKQLIHHVS